MHCSTHATKHTHIQHTQLYHGIGGQPIRSAEMGLLSYGIDSIYSRVATTCTTTLAYIQCILYYTCVCLLSLSLESREATIVGNTC